MGVQCLLPDCGHCSDHDKCKYYKIPKDLFEYYKWNHFLQSVVNINEQLCSLLKLSQIMLLSFLCQSFFVAVASKYWIFPILYLCGEGSEPVFSHVSSLFFFKSQFNVPKRSENVFFTGNFVLTF